MVKNTLTLHLQYIITILIINYFPSVRFVSSFWNMLLWKKIINCLIPLVSTKKCLTVLNIYFHIFSVISLKALLSFFPLCFENENKRQTDWHPGEGLCAKSMVSPPYTCTSKIIWTRRSVVRSETRLGKFYAETDINTRPV